MIENFLKKINNLTNKQKIIIIIIIFLVIIIGFVFLYKIFYVEEDEIIIQSEAEESANNEENNVDENTIQNTKENKIGILNNKNTIVVHVVGEVNSPGVVTLNEGARIIDAINAAGGKTEDADLSKVNLAYVIEDGVQIYIPSITETAKISESEQKEIKYIREDAGEGIILTTASEEKDEKQLKVNINTANLEKLQTLPGVGESTAQKIIEYREKNGKFAKIEDIKNVSGIGDSKYNSLKDNIIV